MSVTVKTTKTTDLEYDDMGRVVREVAESTVTESHENGLREALGALVEEFQIQSDSWEGSGDSIHGSIYQDVADRLADLLVDVDSTP